MIGNESGRGNRLLAALALWLPLAIGAQALADDGVGATPLYLRKIMKEIGRNTQSTAAAISMEDWAQVASLAPKIAAHPEPPVSEKIRILAYLGADAARFRGFDEQTHSAAHAMAEAAQRGDGMGVIQSFAKMQEACLACHQSFRKPFVDHFYGKHGNSTE